MESGTKRIALATMFGVLLFLFKIVLPSPVDKMVVVFHALLLALGALLLRKTGATYVAFIGGILTALWRIAWAPFTFAFALLYGFLVDGLFFLFRINTVKGTLKTRKLVAVMTVSTALMGLLSYYTTVYVFGLLQRNLIFEIGLLLTGTLNGAVAGYLIPIIWNKYLKNLVL